MTIFTFIAFIVMIITYNLYLANRGKRVMYNIELACAGDDDMKIAGKSDSSRRSAAEDDAEAAAKQFLSEKNAGNIDKARALGKAYAKTLLELDSRADLALPGERTMLETHHQLLLCSYAVNRVIAERSPNSILAQTSLNIFYNEVEASDPSLYRHISDMAAFSLYILSKREGGSSAGIGVIYARLCGFEGDSEKIAEGEAVYMRFYDFCSREMDVIGYSDVK